MCFERAADSYWEKKSKTAGLRATTNHLCDLNPEDAHEILRQAAEIFEGIGIINIAAQCFSDLGDHEKAGKHFKQRGMVPPFQPLSMAFSNINYYVDVPLVRKKKSRMAPKKAWSVDSIGWSKRGWKTTLMDVLAGRKTGGVVKVLLQLDPFLNELTIMFERSTETGSVWFIMPPFHVLGVPLASLKPKAVRNKMAVAGEAIDYKCLIRFTNGKKTISTSCSRSAGRAGNLQLDGLRYKAGLRIGSKTYQMTPNNELMIPEDPKCNKEGLILFELTAIFIFFTASNDVSLRSSGQCNSWGPDRRIFLPEGLLDRSEIPPYLNGEILSEVKNLAANCNETDLKEFNVKKFTNVPETIMYDLREGSLRGLEEGGTAKEIEFKLYCFFLEFEIEIYFVFEY
ncbi:hypothetical protein Ahy_B02g059909 [Arachis hypogaea]|uniref:Uncharacterized protein n=1 Tax=Arachis hypogaea TaxID=3818 RepID=A0A445AHJ0_ARAHY|nr:hypothetical protein Ahy_B02g059909 [Arachis hypogaea]